MGNRVTAEECRRREKWYRECAAIYAKRGRRGRVRRLYCERQAESYALRAEVLEGEEEETR